METKLLLFNSEEFGNVRTICEGDRILFCAKDVAEALGKLRVIYPNIMKLSYDNTRTRTNRIIDGAEDVQRKSPLQLFEELYEQQNNQPMSEEQRAFTQELIESIWEGNV